MAEATVISAVSVLVPIVVLCVLLRVLAPNASRHLAGVLPTGDRPVDRHIIGQTERRGAVLAACASGSIATAVAAGGTGAGGLLMLGAVSAVAFRVLPGPTGWLLGGLGALATLQDSVASSCDGGEASRRALALVLIVGGLVVFFLVRLPVRAAGLGRGGGASIVLIVFGIIALGEFLSGPFGIGLVDLVGIGGGLSGVVLAYAGIVAMAAVVPGFAASIIGLTLLLAEISGEAVVGTDGCGSSGSRSGVIIAVCVGFAGVWLIAGRLTRGKG